MERAIAKKHDANDCSFGDLALMRLVLYVCILWNVIIVFCRTNSSQLMRRLKETIIFAITYCLKQLSKVLFATNKAKSKFVWSYTTKARKLNRPRCINRWQQAPWKTVVCSWCTACCRNTRRPSLRQLYCTPTDCRRTVSDNGEYCYTRTFKLIKKHVNSCPGNGYFATFVGNWGRGEMITRHNYVEF